jgi:hypothetical protein
MSHTRIMRQALRASTRKSSIRACRPGTSNCERPVVVQGDHKVGYGRPPVDRRFKPGQSGNPRGTSRKLGHTPYKEQLKGIVTDELERSLCATATVLTVMHPWFGRSVAIHEVIVARQGQGRCAGAARLGARLRKDQACGRQGSNAVSCGCRTRRRNTHGTVVREVLYRLHPWFGRSVAIHEVIVKGGREVFRCSVEGHPSGRWLELPAWMFDRAACAQMDMAAAPSVDVAALSALTALLQIALKDSAGSSNALLSSASRTSHERNRGEAHATSERPFRRSSGRTTPDRPVRASRSGRGGRNSGMDRSSSGDARDADAPDGPPPPGARRQRPGSVLDGGEP